MPRHVGVRRTYNTFLRLRGGGCTTWTNNGNVDEMAVIRESYKQMMDVAPKCVEAEVRGQETRHEQKDQEQKEPELPNCITSKDLPDCIPRAHNNPFHLGSMGIVVVNDKDKRAIKWQFGKTSLDFEVQEQKRMHEELFDDKSKFETDEGNVISPLETNEGRVMIFIPKVYGYGSVTREARKDCPQNGMLGLCKGPERCLSYISMDVVPEHKQVETASEYMDAVKSFNGIMHVLRTGGHFESGAKYQAFSGEHYASAIKGRRNKLTGEIHGHNVSYMGNKTWAFYDFGDGEIHKSGDDVKDTDNVFQVGEKQTTPEARQIQYDDFHEKLLTDCTKFKTGQASLSEDDRSLDTSDDISQEDDSSWDTSDDISQDDRSLDTSDDTTYFNPDFNPEEVAAFNGFGGGGTSLQAALAKKAKFANRRARYRHSTGPPITTGEVTSLWERSRGLCEHCGVRLHFRWNARDPPSDFAVLDRVDGTDNRGYAGNARFLCFGCNSERGGWELVRKLQRDLTSCRRRLP